MQIYSYFLSVFLAYSNKLRLYRYPFSLLFSQNAKNSSGSKRQQKKAAEKHTLLFRSFLELSIF